MSKLINDFESELGGLFTNPNEPTGFEIEVEKPKGGQEMLFEPNAELYPDGKDFPETSPYKDAVSDLAVAMRWNFLEQNKYVAGIDPVSSSPNTSLTAIAVVRKEGEQIVTEHLQTDNNNKIYDTSLMDEVLKLSEFYNIPTIEEKPKKKGKTKAERQEEALNDQVFLESFLADPHQRCYIGVDNGVSGSIGIIKEDGTYGFFTTPTRKALNYTKAIAYITRINPVELTKLLSCAGPGSMVMVERPMVNPARFVPTVSALRAFEATITVLETLELPYEVCDSREWQKPLLPSGLSGDDLKPASLDVGRRLFPLTYHHKHPDRDGMLIAELCKRKHK